MKIEKIRIKNFRCFDDIEVDFDPHLNVFVGVNGSGKTAILAALRVSIGSFFLGSSQQKEKQIGIGDNDVRVVNFESNFESKLPSEIITTGIVNGKQGRWSRERPKQTAYSKTHHKNAQFIKKEAKNLEDLVVKNGNGVQLPIIAFYATERLKVESKASESIEILGSRLRGYFNALQFSSNRKVFEEWFKKQEIARIQNIQRRENKNFDPLELVRNCLIQCIPNCKDIYADFSTDKITMTFEDGSRQPFDNLSDGVLIMLTVVSDIAYRCIVLNPAMSLEANHTEGVVLIDEIELHLHPSWQRHAVSDLRKIFPNIQFFITTHSPQVVSAVPRDSLYILKDGVLNQQKIKTIEKGFAYSEGRDSNALLVDIFGIEERPEEYTIELKKFYQLLEEENLTEAQFIFDNLREKWGSMDSEVVKANMYLEDLKRELAA